MVLRGMRCLLSRVDFVKTAVDGARIKGLLNSGMNPQQSGKVRQDYPACEKYQSDVIQCLLKGGINKEVEVVFGLLLLLAVKNASHGLLPLS